MRGLAGLILTVVLAVAASLFADVPTTSPSQAMVTRVYDVADVLVLPVAQWQAPSGASPMRPAHGEAISELRDAIIAKISPRTWEGASGGKGVIRISAVGQQLVVRQTPEVHEQIGAFFEKARAAQAIQVCVDTRFVQVGKAALEDIGISWVASDKAQPATRPSSQPAKAEAAASGAYLKESQVQFLMDRVNKSRGKTIAAPSLMLMNGGEGMIRQMDTRRYVGSVTPTTRPGGEVLYASKQEQAEDGISLQVRANVSTDRKWVTLYLRPHMSRVLSMEQFTFSSPKLGPPVITIQQPTEQHIEVDTLVSVPDGDWLLLGGQVIAERGNKNPADGEEVLLILVRPRIVEGK